MTRAFPESVKRAAWARSGGHCECGAHAIPLKITKAEYDHYPVPFSFGGTNTLDNCRVLDANCHRKITSEVDVPRIAKADRIEAKRAGLRKSKRPFPKRVDPWGKRHE